MQNKPMTPEENEAWVRRFYEKSAEYLASKGVVAESFILGESRYLIPLVIVWKIVGTDGTKKSKKQNYWVITGEVPTDHIVESGAKDARDALRAFSLRWQLKADQILQMENPTEDQTNFANLLIDRAGGIYDLFGSDTLWGDNTGK